jgi:hypothetical protein
MTSSCAQCHEPLASNRGFCGKCGTRQPERVAASLRLSVDVTTIRHFEAAARCLLRLRVENLGDRPLQRVEFRCQVSGEPIAAQANARPLPGGGSEVVPLWLVPRVAGYHELSGVMVAVDGADVRSVYRVGQIQFRVASAAEAARVQVVHIDQRNARVVDNSRSTFAADPVAKGGLIAEGEGDWKPVVLEALPAEEAARLVPDLAPAAALPPLSHRPEGPALAEGAELEHAGRKYRVGRPMGRSEQFALYQSTLADGRPGIIKMASSAGDNPALDREAYILGLMAEEAARLDREAGDRPSFNYQYFFPELADSFLHPRAGGARVNVLAFPSAIEQLVQLQPLARLADGGRTRVDPRTGAWILGKALKVLGFAHQLGVSNGRVVQENVLLETESHGLLLFDWTQATLHPGGQVPGDVARREIAQAARLTADFLGADPASGTLPASDQLTDRRFEEQIRRMAAGTWADAGAAHRAFYDLLAEIWPRKFHPFTTYRREG